MSNFLKWNFSGCDILLEAMKVGGINVNMCCNLEYVSLYCRIYGTYHYTTVPDFAAKSQASLDLCLQVQIPCKFRCHQEDDLVLLSIHLRNGIKKGPEAQQSWKRVPARGWILHIIALWSIFRCLRHWTLFLGRNPAKLLTHHGISRIDLMMQLDDAKWCYVIFIRTLRTLYPCSHCISMYI